MNKSKINAFEFSSIIPLVVSNSILGSGYLYLYNYSNKSAILSMILGFIFSIPFILIIFRLFNLYQNDSITHKLKNIYPKFFFYVINIIFILISLSISSLIFFRMTSFFYSQFTGEFSKYVIALVLLCTTFYLTNKNIEIISRFSSVIIFICLFIYLFDSISLMPEIEINNLLPIIDCDIKSILSSAFVFSILFSGPSYLILMIPKENIKDKKVIKKYVIISYILSSLFLLIMNSITLGVLGIDLIKLYKYPVYVVLKKIQIVEFINSIENITVLMWFFILIFTSSISLYFSKNSLIEMFNIKSNKISILINIVLNLLIAFTPLIIFDDKIFFNNPSSAIIPVTLYIIIYVLIILTLIINKFKTNKIR